MLGTGKPAEQSLAARFGLDKFKWGVSYQVSLAAKKYEFYA